MEFIKSMLKNPAVLRFIVAGLVAVLALLVGVNSAELKSSYCSDPAELQKPVEQK